MDKFLKNIKAENLKDAFYKQITTQIIKSETDSAIYRRGVDYTDSVQEIEGFKNQIIAEVLGSDYYEVVLEYSKDESMVRASCTCPYFDEGGICKHIVGTALYTLQNKNEVFENVEDETPQSNTEVLDNEQLLEKISKKLKDLTKKDVQNMSLQKLKNLVLEIKELSDKGNFRPNNEVTGVVIGGIYMENVGVVGNTKNISKNTISEAEKEKQQEIFDEVQSNINEMLEEDYVNNIPLFEKKLDKNLEKLNHLDRSFLKEICNYYIEVIEGLSNMQDNDLLWVEWWNGRSETYYEGTNLNEYLINLLEKMDNDEVFEWGMEFYKIEDCENGTDTFFDVQKWIDDFFVDNDEMMQKLIDVFMHKAKTNTFVGEQKDHLFNLVEDELTTEQSLSFFGNSYLENNEYLESYANALIREEKVEEARKVFEAKFKKENYDFSWLMVGLFKQYIATFETTLDKFTLLENIETWIKPKDITKVETEVLSKYLELLFDLKKYDQIITFTNDFAHKVETKKEIHYKEIFFDCAFFHLKALKAENKTKEFLDYLQKIEKSTADFNLNFMVLNENFPDFQKEITQLAHQKLNLDNYVMFLKNTNQITLYETTFLERYDKLQIHFASPFFEDENIQKRFPEKCKDFFVHCVKQLEQQANNAAYDNIGFYLVKISKLDTTKATELANHIRRNYRARRNLMAVLTNMGF